MVKNFFFVVFRNLRRNKNYTFVNLSGLSISIISFVFILLFVQDEFSYDRFNKNAKDIYRVTLKTLNKDGSVSRQWGLVSPGYGSQLKQDFQAIENTVRLYPWSQPILTVDSKKGLEEQFAFADPDVFKIFSFELIAGDPATVLNGPDKIVFSQSMAKKYFGDDDPVGKTIQYKEGDNEKLLIVTGVMKDIPDHSHFKFDFFASFETWSKSISPAEINKLSGNYNYLTYVKLKKGAKYQELAKEFSRYADERIPAEEKKQQSYAISLQPLLDIHLKSNVDTGIEKQGSIQNVYVFLIIGFLILIIACINYSNLVIAKAAKRMKEIGIRKVSGASRHHLITQFLGETFIMALLAAVVAWAGITLLLPYFNSFSGKELSMNFTQQVKLITLILIIIVIITFFAGSYPAFYLSRLDPVESLRRDKLSRHKRFSLRSNLIVFQFVISIGLITGMIVTKKQMLLVTQSDLGFAKDNIITIRANGKIKDQCELFRQQLYENKDIDGISISSGVPTGNLTNAQKAELLSGVSSQAKQITFRLPYVNIDQDFIRMYNLKLAAGNNITTKTGADTNTTFLLNEEAVREIGWSSMNEAIGKRMHYGRYSGVIVGVIKDFHFESFRSQISPIIFVNKPANSWVSVKIRDKANIASVLNFINQKWNLMEQDYSFDYSFIDYRISRLYERENKLQQLITLFTLLAIIISCLGLFGLSAFVLEHRTKEIGIRKVLGADIKGLVGLLSKDFIVLVAVAAIVAFPLSWWALNTWLKDFAYRISISWWIFIVAAAAALLIALLTVSFHAIKAAIANPVKSLRTE